MAVIVQADLKVLAEVAGCGSVAVVVEKVLEVADLAESAC